MQSHRRGFVTIAILASAVAGACVEAPTSVTPPARSDVLASGPKFVACSDRTPSSTVATVGPLGGLLSVAGHSISIPAGAVLAPTLFTIEVPQSDIAEVEIHAVGVEHFLFEVPVTVTMSYAGCNASENSQLSVWYIDRATRERLEYMGGSVDRSARTVTFTTGHLSGYAIAD